MSITTQVLQDYPHGSILIFLEIQYCLISSWKIFKFIMFWLLDNAFENLTVESRHFYSCLQAKLPQVLIITHSPTSPEAQRRYSFPSGSVFSKIYFSPSRKGGTIEAVVDFGFPDQFLTISSFCIRETSLEVSQMNNVKILYLLRRISSTMLLASFSFLFIASLIYW